MPPPNDLMNPGSEEMDLAQAISFLESLVKDPTRGLPDEIFFFVSKITPLVNVDLLIKDERGRTLLSWRDDEHCGTGWHIPGGIVRHKETLHQRVRKVALEEIGAEMHFDPEPVAINQIIHPNRVVRSHFISFLYRCHMDSSFSPPNTGLHPGQPGYLQWHDRCPTDLIEVHHIYRKFI